MKNTLIIYSNYSKLKQKGERVFVETNKQEITIPLSNIDGILIFGKTTLTSDVISLCTKRNIPILLFTQYGLPKAQILPPTNSEGTNRRIKQFELFFKKRLSVAKLFVDKKCQEIEFTFGIPLDTIRRRIDGAKTIEDVLGLEGLASRLMFKKFQDMVSQTEFDFFERTYNPPKDEVNALLSFLYTLSYNLSIAVILTLGYDPYVSFLHTKKGKHAAFASDIMEIVRPTLTKIAGELIVRKLIGKEDFTKEKDFIMLKKQTIAKVLDIFQEHKEGLIYMMKTTLRDLENL